MAREEDEKLSSFKNLCTCGGYAWQMNGRPENRPHMDWCPQMEEHAEWWDAFHEPIAVAPAPAAQPQAEGGV